MPAKKQKTRAQSSKSKKNSSLKSSYRFSRWQILVFAAAFAIIGGFILLRSFAAVITNPTHLIDAQWNYPNSGTSNYTMTDVNVDMTPEVDPGSDGYFYATEFYYASNTGYMGLQANGIDSSGKIVPKTASITIYGATSASPASGIQSSCWNPSGEGYQCNLNDVYNWLPTHTYRFYLALQTPDNGSGNEVWSAKFADVTTNSIIQLGTINVPTSWQYLGHAIITFHERFSGDTTTCSNIRPSLVVFSNAQANNGSLAATTDSSYRSGTTSCIGYLDNHYTNGAIYSGYGPNILCYDPTLSASATNCGDTTAPTVTVTSPANGSIAGRTVAISALATDNVGVVKTEVYIDGKLYSSSNSSSVQYTWNTKRASRGTHTITVRAYDAANNVGQSLVTITK